VAREHEHGIMHQMHIAACAAQMAEAAAVAVELGWDNALNIDAAMSILHEPNENHIEAAVIMLALMLGYGGGTVEEWRDSVPKLVANIVAAHQE